MALDRDEMALVVLSLAEGADFTPVQIQKALFLASDKAADAFKQQSRYDFQPYDYGPFDQQVYSDMEQLAPGEWRKSISGREAVGAHMQLRGPVSLTARAWPAN